MNLALPEADVATAAEVRDWLDRFAACVREGRQYSSTAYIETLKKHTMVQSMSRRGNCYDNAVAESFFSSLKNELVNHCSFKTGMKPGRPSSSASKCFTIAGARAIRRIS